jgi:hypothetical protein
MGWKMRQRSGKGVDGGDPKAEAIVKVDGCLRLRDILGDKRASLRKPFAPNAALGRALKRGSDLGAQVIRIAIGSYRLPRGHRIS